MELNRRTLIGTVGYHLLQNHSLGPILLPKLEEIDWPELVVVEEMNWGPIAIVQYFESLEIPFEKVIFLVAIERPNRIIGDIDIFKWKGKLPPETQIQACVGDAATGVISVENLLVIGEYFKIWPKDVYLIDVEPGEEVAGEHLTEEVRQRIPEIMKTLKTLVFEDTEFKSTLKYLQGDTLFKEKEK